MPTKLVNPNSAAKFDNAELARKIEGLERKYDEQFSVVFAAIKQLIAPPEPAKKRIGFHSEK